MASDSVTTKFTKFIKNIIAADKKNETADIPKALFVPNRVKPQSSLKKAPSDNENSLFSSSISQVGKNVNMTDYINIPSSSFSDAPRQPEKSSPSIKR